MAQISSASAISRVVGGGTVVVLVQSTSSCCRLWILKDLRDLLDGGSHVEGQSKIYGRTVPNQMLLIIGTKAVETLKLGQHLDL